MQRQPIKSLWKLKKLKFEDSWGGYYQDNSAGIGELMSIGAPGPIRLETYDDVLTTLQSPDSIPIADISFRIYVQLD